MEVASEQIVVTFSFKIHLIQVYNVKPQPHNPNTAWGLPTAPLTHPSVLELKKGDKRREGM